MADFDGARYLSQWARLAKTINAPAPTNTEGLKVQEYQAVSSFLISASRKEQGLFIITGMRNLAMHVNIPH